jgi:hypothetical protein
MNPRHERYFHFAERVHLCVVLLMRAHPKIIVQIWLPAPLDPHTQANVIKYR